MVVCGAPLTYNADAFALAQGSMLDGLIDQLPGADLRSDGKIYLNGEFVSELLVNGDKFFRDDPRVALENIPAYMVNNILVFHRNARRKDRTLKEMPLVMDVKLKKQFIHGWTANAEAGYGTANRYLGRLFGMLFTPDSRLTIVGNINNTNDDRKPGQTDSWNPNWQTAGRADIAKAGIDYLWNSRLRNWKVEANLMAENKRGDLQSQKTSERYLEGGNLFGSSTSKSASRQWRFSTDDKISFHIPRVWVDLKPKASFIREKANNANTSDTKNALTELLNSLDETSDTYRRQWEAGTDLNARWNLPKSDKQLSNNFTDLWNDRNLETLTERNLPISNTHLTLPPILRV